MAGKKRKSYQGRKYKRQHAKDTDKAVICYCPRVAPDVMRVHLSYNKTFIKSTTTGILEVDVLRGNSIFDPDTGTTGDQPMGYDEWNLFYRRYRVIAATAKVRFYADQETVPLSGGITPLTSVVTYANPEAYKQSAYAVQKHIGTRNGKGSMYLEKYMTTDKMRGLPYGGTRINSDLSSSFGANPNQQWQFHIWLAAEDGTTTWDGSYDVTIVYDVELYDREPLTQSLE